MYCGQKQWMLHIWAKGAYFHLETRKPHAVLSEVSGNLPAGSNENCTGSSGFGKMTVELKKNCNRDNLPKSNFEHFPC